MQPVRFGTIIKIIAPPIFPPIGLREIGQSLTQNESIRFYQETLSEILPSGKNPTSCFYTNTQPTNHIKMIKELKALYTVMYNAARTAFSDHCDSAEFKRQFADLFKAANRGNYPDAITIDFPNNKVGPTQDIEQQ